jgi:hypothetical protein
MGICSRCDIKIEGKSKLCADCKVLVAQEKAANRRTTVKGKRRVRGECLTCAAPNPDSDYCPQCTTGVVRCKQRWKQEGRCYECGKPRENLEVLSCFTCSEKKKVNIAAWRRKLKIETFVRYGGFVCACCGENNEAFLQLDHINGGGCEHRKNVTGGGGTQLYTHLRDNNWPEGYQVLCANCNWGKRFLGVCPHNLPFCSLTTVATLTETDYSYE